MTDRELLEAAAKAAGMRLTWGEKYMIGGDEVDCTDLPYAISDDREEAPVYWNPFDDDGDAFRLAVKLRINIYNPPGKNASASCVTHGPFVSYFNEKDADAASVRRAIVRAAAASPCLPGSSCHLSKEGKPCMAGECKNTGETN